MKNIAVKDGQNLLDVALEQYGAVEALVFLLNDNELPLSPELQAGQQLRVDDTKIIDAGVTTYLSARSKQVVTDSNTPDMDGVEVLDGQFKKEHFKAEHFKVA